MAVALGQTDCRYGVNAKIVLMIERDWDVVGVGLPEKRAAAHALLTRLGSSPAPPQVAIGRFGHTEGEHDAAIVQPSTDDYGVLHDAVETYFQDIKTSGANDVSAALNAAAEELGRKADDPVPDRWHILIIVSSGDPEQCDTDARSGGNAKEARKRAKNLAGTLTGVGATHVYIDAIWSIHAGGDPPGEAGPLFMQLIARPLDPAPGQLGGFSDSVGPDFGALPALLADRIGGKLCNDCDRDGLDDLVDQSLPDSDSDTWPDPCEECDNDPNKIEPGICGCGTPDDDDSDGTPNCHDDCPDEPNKTEPGTPPAGCPCDVPDTDTDADGVGDVCDNCPQEANRDQADADGDGTGDACDDDGKEPGGGSQQPMPPADTDEIGDQIGGASPGEEAGQGGPEAEPSQDGDGGASDATVGGRACGIFNGIFLIGLPLILLPPQQNLWVEWSCKPGGEAVS